MAQQCGTKDNNKLQMETPETPTGAVVRRVGFCTLVTMALLLLAGTILLPAWATLTQRRYELACNKLRVAEAQATVDAMDRLIAEAPTNEVLTKRLAWSKLGLYPQNEVIVMDERRRVERLPGTLAAIRYDNPAEPGSTMLSAAKKVQRPATRRGLLFLAVAMGVSAMLLFAPPGYRVKRWKPGKLPPPIVTRDRKKRPY